MTICRLFCQESLSTLDTQILTWQTFRVLGRSGVNRRLQLVAICAIVCGAGYGQAVSQISGIVKDETGAVVPGVQVTATQTETGLKRSVQTDEGGAYLLV